MNKIDIARGMVFQKLCIGKSTFEERLICQKKVYLLQSLGVHLGFNYDWYIYGPYSKGLASYVYSNFDVLSDCDFTKYRLSKKVIDKIDIVNNLTNEKTEELTDANWYELLASLLYISEHRYFWNIKPITGNRSAKEILLAIKKQFTEEQCDKANYCLIKSGFSEYKEL